MRHFRVTLGLKLRSCDATPSALVQFTKSVLVGQQSPQLRACYGSMLTEPHYNGISSNVIYGFADVVM